MTGRNRKCNIVADSCCDLPRDLFDLLDIQLLKFSYFLEDGEHLDDMFSTITPHQFYERLRKGEQAQTAQVAYATLLEMCEQAAAEPLPTVFLCFTSGLSGTYEALAKACEETLNKHPEAEIYAVDTLLPSVAEGLLVWEAVRQADRGMTAAELVAWVEEARFFVNGYFTLPDLESLRRGGRVPDVAALAGSKLDLKPILSFDTTGHLTLHAVTRGHKKAVKQLLQIFNERLRPDVSRVVILASADNPKELKQMEEQILKERAADPPVLVTASVGPVIGAHVGPDMLAIVFWGPDRRLELSLPERIAQAVSDRSDSLRSLLRKTNSE